MSLFGNVVDQEGNCAAEPDDKQQRTARKGPHDAAMQEIFYRGQHVIGSYNNRLVEINRRKKTNNAQKNGQEKKGDRSFRQKNTASPHDKGSNQGNVKEHNGDNDRIDRNAH